MRNGSAGCCAPILVALSHLPTSTSATTVNSPSRTTSRNRLGKWGNDRSPPRELTQPECSWQPTLDTPEWGLVQHVLGHSSLQQALQILSFFMHVRPDGREASAEYATQNPISKLANQWNCH